MVHWYQRLIDTIWGYYEQTRVTGFLHSKICVQESDSGYSPPTETQSMTTILFIRHRRWFRNSAWFMARTKLATFFGKSNPSAYGVKVCWWNPTFEIELSGWARKLSRSTTNWLASLVPIPQRKNSESMYNYGEGLYFDIKQASLNDLGEQRRSMGEHRANMSVSFDKLMHSMTKQLPALEEEDSRSAFTVLHTFSHLLINFGGEKWIFARFHARATIFRLWRWSRKARWHPRAHLSPVIWRDTRRFGSTGFVGIEIDEIAQAALESLEFCSSRPYFFEHLPTADETNGAACHTCVLPETSCELANHMLDRNWGFRR